MNAIYKYQTQIKEHHLDTFSHVNNATYIALFEEARWEWITLNGYGLDTVHTTKMAPVVLELNVRFMKELNNREHITIECQCVSFNKKIMNVEQKMLNAEGQVCCQATFVFALMDLNVRKIVAPTKKWLTAIGYTETN